MRPFLVLLSVLFVLGGCQGEPESGPVDIKYGRETCEYCRMIISDPRFAVEVRQKPGAKVYKFDDIGDAIPAFQGASQALFQ